MTDREFNDAIQRIINNDKSGLREIYEAYVTYIYSIVLGTVKNKENAEDLTSDFFIKLWDKAETFVNNKGHRAWMATIARNMAVDFLRKHKRESLTDIIPESMNDETPEKEVVGNLTMQEAMALLDDQERQIMDFKIVGQFTFKEIANMMSMPQGTVSWKYQNAIKKLRRSHYGG